MTQVTAEQVVEAYIRTRAQIEEIQKQAEEKIAPLKKFQEAREEWLTGEINRTGLKNLPTKFGTAYLTRAESVSCEDWDTFLDFAIFEPLRELLMPEDVGSEILNGVIEKAKETLRLNFLQKAINKTAALELMGELDAKTNSRPNPPPPGAKYSAIQKLGVRKA